MKQVTCIILCLLLNFNYLYGQSFENIVEILNTCKSVSEFKNKAPNYKEPKNELDTVSAFNAWVRRDIGFGYVQYRDNFSASDSKGASHDYVITCILYEDSIVLGHIEEYRDYFFPIRIMPKKVFSIDSQYLSQYIEQREKVFKKNIKVNALLADLRKDLTIEFGCGEAGQSYSKEYRKMKRYVESKNKTSLNKLLRSANCELQVYGAIGLLELKKKGINLTKEEKEIIDFLRRQNTTITYCGGSLYGLSGTFTEIVRE